MLLRKQRVQGFSLAESLLGKKRTLSSYCWALLFLEGVRDSPSDLPTLFIKASVLNFFIFPCVEQDLSLKTLLIKSQVF